MREQEGDGKENGNWGGKREKNACQKDRLATVNNSQYNQPANARKTSVLLQ